MLQATGDGQPLALNLDDAKTKELVTKFEKAFANPAREPEIGFAPSVKAALFQPPVRLPTHYFDLMEKNDLTSLSANASY